MACAMLHGTPQDLQVCSRPASLVATGHVRIGHHHPVFWTSAHVVRTAARTAVGSRTTGDGKGNEDGGAQRGQDRFVGGFHNGVGLLGTSVSRVISHRAAGCAFPMGSNPTMISTGALKPPVLGEPDGLKDSKPSGWCSVSWHHRRTCRRAR